MSHSQVTAPASRRAARPARQLGSLLLRQHPGRPDRPGRAALAVLAKRGHATEGTVAI